jgi:hypothetical protein
MGSQAFASPSPWQGEGDQGGGPQRSHKNLLESLEGEGSAQAVTAREKPSAWVASRPSAFPAARRDGILTPVESFRHRSSTPWSPERPANPTSPSSSLDPTGATHCASRPRFGMEWDLLSGQASVLPPYGLTDALAGVPPGCGLASAGSLSSNEASGESYGKRF